MKNGQGQIYHVTDNHSPSHPGVTAVITQLTRFLAGQGWSTTVLAAGKALTPVPEGVGLVEFPLRPGGRTWRYPDKLKPYLQKIKKASGNIFHLHGVWGAPQWLAARAAVHQKVPALLTAHDMLSPWHWQDGRLRRLKKLVYWRALAYPAFRNLTVIHAITPKERDDLARLFPGQRPEVIPNAVDLEEAENLLSDSESGSAPPSGKYLLFLGRLHPQKGVDILLNAFARSLKGRDFRLVLVGPDSTSAYTAKLKSVINLSGLEKQVTFLGPVFGPQKWRLYRDAWALCSPSQTEVVGLVNLEAAAAGAPVITTHETGLFDWEEGGGILVHPQVEPLQAALEQVFSWSDRERQDRGRKLRQLVERRYSWKAVGPLWLELYAKILGR